MSDVEKLVELINAEIETELENLIECSDKNSCMGGMIIGTIDAYKNVLIFIKELNE